MSIPISVDGNTIISANKINVLGVTLDDKLKFNSMFRAYVFVCQTNKLIQTDSKILECRTQINYSQKFYSVEFLLLSGNLDI